MLNITGRTRVHGLIGSPVQQVLAPGMITRMLAESGRDAVMVPLHIPPARIEAALPELQAMPNLDSLIVTVPFKFIAARHCASVSSRVRVLGAVNIMRREADGRWHDDNFDGAGFVAGLLAAGHSVTGKRVFMVGAGGAGSAISAALLEAGAAHIGFHDLLPAAEDKLLATLHGAFGPASAAIERGGPAGYDIALNASCAGLHAGDALPFDPAALAPGTLVGDVISDPRHTPLLMAAERAGHPWRDGVHMLEGQIRLMFDFITGA